jgi:beta-mannosidase
VDYARQPKPAYYVIRRELAPLTVGLARTPSGAAAWAVSARTETIHAELVVQSYDLDGTPLFTDRRNISLQPNQATELGPIAFEQNGSTVVAARLLVGGAFAARTMLWPEPFKYLMLPDPEITVERLSDDQVRVSANRPAKGVWLQAGDGVTWSDNMFDLVPNDPQTVTVHRLGAEQIQVQWLRSS